MSAAVELRPGLMPLVEWRAIYRGASVVLDPFARPDVEAGAQALEAILASGEAELPPEEDAPSIAELMQGGGDLLPSGLVRLSVALKLGSLAQGVSGVRWRTLRGVCDFLAAGLLPAIPADGVTDRLALAYLFAALTGTGEVVKNKKRQPAAKALKEADIPALRLSPPERSALLSGSPLTIAAALAGLFEAERVLHTALVAAALSASAMRRPPAPTDPRVLRLQRQPGQIEVAAALRVLDASRAPEAVADPGRGAEGKAARHAPLRMGVSLDLLRQAAVMLERAANAVTEDRLVFWQSAEIVPGIEDRSPVTYAADLVARELVVICDLSQERTAALAGNADTEHAGDRAAPQAQAAGFVARMREQAEASGDPRRLLPLAGTAALVLAIELLQAARLSTVDVEDADAPLHQVLRHLREAAPVGAEGGVGPAGDLAAIAERVGSGALAAAAGVHLPSVVAPPETDRSG